jgi:hypothetical protein
MMRQNAFGYFREILAEVKPISDLDGFGRSFLGSPAANGRCSLPQWQLSPSELADTEPFSGIMAQALVRSRWLARWFSLLVSVKYLD